MTDTNEATDNAQTQPVELPEKLREALGILEASPMFAAVVPMLNEKFVAHYALIKTNNSNVLAVREANDTDPESTEYQDNTWKRIVSEELDPEMVKLDARRQKLIAEEQKILATLREKSKNHMRPALSEEAVQKLRKDINDGKKVIEQSVAASASVAEMADQMLKTAGNPIENGIWSLMPQPESLMNVRGKKAAAKSSGEGYATRVVEAFVNGETANRNVKRKGVEVFAGHFNYVAEYLSKMWDDKSFPENQVTSQEVEKAYYDSKGAEFRDSESMPVDHTFEFTKNVKVRNGADDTVKEIPTPVSIRIVRWTKETKDAAGTLDKSDDNSAEGATDNSTENAEGTTADTTMAGNIEGQA